MPTSARGPKCGSIKNPNETPPKIEPALKKLDAIAGMPKTFLAFNIPMTSAASDTIRMNGNMMRVRVTVRAALAESKPGASKATSSCEKTMPARQIAPRTMIVRVATLFARRQAAASSLRAIVLLNTVTNAVERAPSANR